MPDGGFDKGRMRIVYVGHIGNVSNVGPVDSRTAYWHSGNFLTNSRHDAGAVINKLVARGRFRREVEALASPASMADTASRNSGSRISGLSLLKVCFRSSHSTSVRCEV